MSSKGSGGEGLGSRSRCRGAGGLAAQHTAPTRSTSCWCGLECTPWYCTYVRRNGRDCHTMAQLRKLEAGAHPDRLLSMSLWWIRSSRQRQTGQWQKRERDHAEDGEPRDKSRSGGTGRGEARQDETGQDKGWSERPGRGWMGWVEAAVIWMDRADYGLGIVWSTEAGK